MSISTLIGIAMSATVLLTSAAGADTLDLKGYQADDGAITIHYQSNVVEPYFATKALLAAKEGGLNISSAADRWIDWAMDMQAEDGNFARYCKENGMAWTNCGPADADDAALALWAELLFAQAPNHGMPPSWMKSAENALTELETLYNTANGLYYISDSLPVSLLMDNLEIYNAFNVISAAHARFGDELRAEIYTNRADHLAASIRKEYLEESSGIFRITTQERTEQTFYPDHVAQLYPMLIAFPYESRDSIETGFSAWIYDYGYGWINDPENDYPWGLIALAALKANDTPTAYCWKNKAEHLRYSGRWNVLEESVLQIINARLPENGNSPLHCMERRL